jgi:Probable Zinc-ribbon domain
VATLADYPHVVAQLDRKNGPIAPESIAYSSHRRLWWRCPAGPDHLWAVPVKDRTVGGAGCPFCAGRAVSVTTALSKVAPAIARQWHPTKNGDLRPRDVVAGSHRAVWWKCPKGPDHQWSARIHERVRGKGCPFCARRRATVAKNLAVVYPELALEWHPTKNGALRPEDVPPRSNRSVWWSCSHGHAWSAQPNDRARGHGCPYCSGRRLAPERSLATLFPSIARQWHPTKNGELTARDVTMSSSRRVWWRCRKGTDHEWQTTVANRGALGTDCPFCANLRVSGTNSLAARFPELTREWHPTKNGGLGPEDVVAGTHRRAWWRCAFGHEWETSVDNRSGRGSGCPECYRLRRRQPVATTGTRRKPVRFAEYEGERHGPVRRVR